MFIKYIKYDQSLRPSPSGLICLWSIFLWCPYSFIVNFYYNILTSTTSNNIFMQCLDTLTSLQQLQQLFMSFLLSATNSIKKYSNTLETTMQPLDNSTNSTHNKNFIVSYQTLEMELLHSCLIESIIKIIPYHDIRTSTLNNIIINQ